MKKSTKTLTLILTTILFASNVFAAATSDQATQLGQMILEKEIAIANSRKQIEKLRIETATLEKTIELVRSTHSTTKWIAIPTIVVGSVIALGSGKFYLSELADSNTNSAGYGIGMIFRAFSGAAMLVGTGMAGGAGYQLYVSSKKVDQIEQLVAAALANANAEEAELAKKEAELTTLKKTIEFLK